LVIDVESGSDLMSAHFDFFFCFDHLIISSTGFPGLRWFVSFRLDWSIGDWIRLSVSMSRLFFDCLSKSPTFNFSFISFRFLSFLFCRPFAWFSLELFRFGFPLSMLHCWEIALVLGRKINWLVRGNENDCHRNPQFV